MLYPYSCHLIFALCNPSKNLFFKIKYSLKNFTVFEKGNCRDTIHQNIKKGYRFLVQGRLDYWKNSESNRDNYSIFAENIEEITEPK